jgi:hypothetical protein
MNKQYEYSKDSVMEVKAKIKQLAAEQVEEKRRLRDPSDTTSGLQSACFRRAIRITAYLNFYNEMRLKPYRHGIREGWDWLHSKFYKEIQATCPKLQPEDVTS